MYLLTSNANHTWRCSSVHLVNLLETKSPANVSYVAPIGSRVVPMLPSGFQKHRNRLRTLHHVPALTDLSKRKITFSFHHFLELDSCVVLSFPYHFFETWFVLFKSNSTECWKFWAFWGGVLKATLRSFHALITSELWQNQNNEWKPCVITRKHGK